MTSTSSFSKYKSRGAYHWDALRRHPRFHDCYSATRYALILEAAHIRSAEKVVDLGCGDGALTYLAWRQLQDGEMIGVEPEPVGRALAAEMLQQHRARVNLLESSSEIKSESQDVVLCAEVIEHVHDPRDLLVEIRRILKPGGRAIISTPVRLTEVPYDKEHVQEFFPNEFLRLVESHFSVEQHKQFCPAFAIELYYWRPMFLLRRGFFRIIMNILSAWLGVPVMRDLSPNKRYYMLQVITAFKN